VKNSRLLICLVFCVLCPPSLFAQHAIVTVVISEASGVQDFGSGFVFTDKGEVLTCYHVIQGAKTIRVFYKGRFYDAKATGVAPARDIARLQLVNVPTPTEYLPLRYGLPTNIFEQQLYVYGFANGLFDSRMPAKATQDHFVLSQEMKDIRSRPLFRTHDVNILPITTTIYKGMSGAPLVASDRTVIGVVSGSLNEGGSVAWAIAAENAKPMYLQVVDAPSGGYVWPSLSLMESGWETLRRQSGVGEDLATKIDQLSDAADALQRQTSTECEEDGPIVAGLNQIREVFNANSLDQVKLAELPNVPGGPAFDAQIVSMQKQVSPLMDRALADGDIIQQLFDDLEAKYLSAMSAAKAYLNDLPSTQRNTTLTKMLERRIVDANQRFENISGEIRRSKQRPHDLKLVTVSDVRAEIERQSLSWSGFQHVYCKLLPDEVDVYKTSAEAFREVLSADPLGGSR
jgi:S1-C subfamily serine protease